MRRRKIPEWVSEARAATKTVRGTFASLRAMRKELAAGTCTHERWARTYASTEEEFGRLTRWFSEWGVKAGTAKNDDPEKDHDLDFSVFSTCLPLLLKAVRAYNDALALIMLSPAGDGREMASNCLVAAEDVAASAFVMIEDTKARRGHHAEVVRSALRAFEQNAARLRLLGPQVHQLVAERVGKEPKVP